MIIDSFGIDKNNSILYFNINEPVIVFSFFKSQCNCAFMMIIYLGNGFLLNEILGEGVSPKVVF
jgi:hypothetical protein